MKRFISCLCGVILTITGTLYSQETTDSCLVTTPTATGVTPLGSYEHGTIDTVSLQNGNLVLNIPLLSLDGRGIDASVSLTYNSRIWLWKDSRIQGQPPVCRLLYPTYDGLPVGWQLNIPKMKYKYVLSETGVKTYSQYTLLENGAAHNFTNGVRFDINGNISKHIVKGYSYDSTYMNFFITNTSHTNYLRFKNGNTLLFGGLFGRPSKYPIKYEDTNGNYLRYYLGSEEGYTGAAASLITSIEDTLGRKIRFNYADNGQLNTIQYNDVNGAVRYIQFQYGMARALWDGADWGNSNQHYDSYIKDITSIVLPNGLTYQFEYDTTLNQGRAQVTAVILPTGGRIRYTYGKSEFPGESMLYDTITKREEYEGQTANAWEYQYTKTNSGSGEPPLTTKVTDPLGNTTKTTFIGTNSHGNIVESKSETYAGSVETGTLIRKIFKTWDTADEFPNEVFPGNEMSGETVNARILLESMNLYDINPTQGQSKAYVYRINSSPRYCPDGNPIEIYENKLTGEASIPGNSVLLRKRTYEYLNQTGIYYTYNILDRPTRENILDPSGNKIAETLYYYDEFSLITRSAVHSERPLNGDVYRGNQTRKMYKLLTGSDVITEKYYDFCGNVIRAKDAKGNESTSTYTATYQFAYPEIITNPLGQQMSYVYSQYSGALISKTDENGKVTGYTYDLMGRPLAVVNPDGGGMNYTYVDTLPLSIISSEKLSATTSSVSTATYDGYGRLHFTRKNDPQGDVLNVTYYDALGRKYRESNPFRDGTNPIFTIYQYDSLGRIIRTTTPDGNNVESQYSGYLTRIYDQTGRWKEYQYDPLENVSSVNENAIVTTSYRYNMLGKLLNVVQGDRTRTFSYDSLGRLVSESNPESGNNAYTYDANSNIVEKDDAKSIHTSYTYDSLNRIISKTFSDGTPSISYSYDGENPLGVTCQNSIGRLSGISTRRIREAFSYDSMGRVIHEFKEIDLYTFAISYTYDLAGNIVSETYPSGRVINRSINTAGKITAVRDATRDIDVVYGIAYAPSGSIAQKTYGNGIINTISFNDRLQPTRIIHGTLFDVSYNYYDPSGNNNDNVMGITDNLVPQKTAAYSYDDLNRLVSASTGIWSQIFSYDIYGNMLSKQGTGGAPSTSYTYNQKNQIEGLAYDQDGNLLEDGNSSFAYDAENQLTASGVYTYIYDECNRRLIKEKMLDYNEEIYNERIFYIYDNNGQVISEYSIAGAGSMCWKKDLIYLENILVKTAENPSAEICILQSSDSEYYYHQDQIGSIRIVTNNSGTQANAHEYYPYGEEVNTQPTTRDENLFTGKLRDIETGLDYFGRRYYGNALGRFLSVDPGLSNTGAPQTWNKYVYCLNNPLKYIDPDGEIIFPSNRDKYFYTFCANLKRVRITKSGSDLFSFVNNRNINTYMESQENIKYEGPSPDIYYVLGIIEWKGNCYEIKIDVKKAREKGGNDEVLLAILHELIHNRDMLMHNGQSTMTEEDVRKNAEEMLQDIKAAERPQSISEPKEDNRMKRISEILFGNIEPRTRRD